MSDIDDTIAAAEEEERAAEDVAAAAINSDAAAAEEEEERAAINSDTAAEEEEERAEGGDAEGGDADNGDAADGVADNGDATDGDAADGDAADGDDDSGDDADEDADDGEADDGEADDGEADSEEAGTGDAGAGEGGGYRPVGRFDAAAVHHLSGMYQSWFLDYASYVILERAVPNIDDGLKPVQRRILYSMKRMDDGRYNKAANIVGHTMQFHPHGDASIGDALVQLGQKDLLVDTQGNWGNIFTGDHAAAPRYIEARLTKFALEVLFNAKTTAWQQSYDGRNKEPITLPAKFPLLLSQGVEGIAVGLSSKILPHNFCELCDAAIAFLRGEDFHLYPDFPTGGSIDISRYNGGQRGGLLRVRAKIDKVDSRTLAIREIPYTKTTTTLIDSITKAVEKGKVKARHVVDNTAADVEILLSLVPGTSLDKTIDALYAFTDCEINISPNCCVIADNKPCFLTVEDVLRHSTRRTEALLRQELLIRRHELIEELFFASLERLFIEKRIYKEKTFEQAASTDEALAFIAERLAPFSVSLVRAITRDDLLRLLDIKMQRILKFNKDKADRQIAALQKEIRAVQKALRQMTEVTIQWFEGLKERYGAAYPRRTEIRNFDTIKVQKVVEATEKLFINRAEGFIGTALKKDELVCSCSDLDEIILFYNDGRYRVLRVAEKVFVGKDIRHLAVYHRNDQRAIYNVIYRDGTKGAYYAKRFNVAAVQRDKDYDLTLGTAGSKIVYFSYNANGEAETVKITLIPTKGSKKTSLLYDFATLAIKGRGARGNLVSRTPIRSVSVKSQGHSTLGGRQVWYDSTVQRLNYDGQGVLLGEFNDDDRLLIILENGDYYYTDCALHNHYESSLRTIERYDESKIWTVVVQEESTGIAYGKRCTLDLSRKRQTLIGPNARDSLLFLSAAPSSQIKLSLAAPHDDETVLLSVDDIPQQSVKSRGRRITRFAVAAIEEIVPLSADEEAPLAETAEEENATTYTFKVDDDGQMSLFDDEG